MNPEERDIDDLLRFLEGAMSEPEERTMRDRLDRSRPLRDELDRLQIAKTSFMNVMEDSASEALKPFFTDRLMRRVNRAVSDDPAVEELTVMLGRIFRPVALAGFFLAVCLAVYNVHLSKDYSVDTTTAEAVLALPPVSTMSIFDLDLYAAEGVVLP